MLDTLLNNHLLLALIILFALALAPVLLVRGYRRRDPTRLDRRARARGDIDRRA